MMSAIEMACKMARKNVTMSTKQIQAKVEAKTGVKVDRRTISGPQRSKRYACGNAFALQYAAQ